MLPIQVTDTAGRTRQYGYDSHGNLLWQQDPLGRETQYQYDPEGRVTQVTDALEKSKYLSWNTCGQLLSYRDCSNAQTLYHYDAHGRLRESINARGEHTHTVIKKDTDSVIEQKLISGKERFRRIKPLTICKIESTLNHPHQQGAHNGQHPSEKN